MEEFFSPQSAAICYNIHVSQRRSKLIFDIGGGQRAPAIGPKTARLEGKTSETAGSRVPRDRLSGELRKRIRRPQQLCNSVLVLPRKPLLSTDEAKMRCCAVWQSCGATSFPMLRPGS